MLAKVKQDPLVAEEDRWKTHCELQGLARKAQFLNGAGVKGSEGSPCRLPQDQLVQVQISYQAFQLGILLFQLLESLGLAFLHAAVFLAPTVISLFGDAQLSAHLRHCLSLRKQHLGLPRGGGGGGGVCRLSAPECASSCPWKSS